MPVERVLPSLEHVEEGPSGCAHTEPQVRRPLTCAVAGLTEDLMRCCHWNARVSCGLVEGIFKGTRVKVILANNIMPRWPRVSKLPPVHECAKKARHEALFTSV